MLYYSFSGDNLASSVTSLSAVSGVSARNVSGGWFDAGDYLKFVQTASYVTSVMLMAVRDYPSLYHQGGSVDFYTEVQIGLNWLLKMWDDTNKVLFYQVFQSFVSQLANLMYRSDLEAETIISMATTISGGCLKLMTRIPPARIFVSCCQDYICPSLILRIR